MTCLRKKQSKIDDQFPFMTQQCTDDEVASSNEDVNLTLIQKKLPSVRNKEQKSMLQKKSKLRTYVGLPITKKIKISSLRTEELTLPSYFARRVHSVRKDTKTEGKVFSTMGMHQNKQEPTHRKAKPANDHNY